MLTFSPAPPSLLQKVDSVLQGLVWFLPSDMESMEHTGKLLSGQTGSDSGFFIRWAAGLKWQGVVIRFRWAAGLKRQSGGK